MWATGPKDRRVAIQELLESGPQDWRVASQEQRETGPKPAYAGVRQRDVPQARARGRHDSRTGMLMCGSVMSFRRERVGVRTQGLVCGRHTLACGSVTSLCDWAQEPADDLHMLTCGSVTSLWQELAGDRTQADVAKQQNRNHFWGKDRIVADDMGQQSGELVCLDILPPKAEGMATVVRHLDGHLAQTPACPTC